MVIKVSENGKLEIQASMGDLLMMPVPGGGYEYGRVVMGGGGKPTIQFISQAEFETLSRQPAINELWSKYSGYGEPDHPQRNGTTEEDKYLMGTGRGM